MNEPIDVVIPWLNPTEKWFSEYKNFCENESPARIRDLNTIRPTIKGILKNLPWVRFIWLIVYDAEQIPDWEELKNDKIRIIYHSDIIPKEFLPNFNSILTDVFIYKIKDLSNLFILAEDDMIFKSPMPKEYFFKNGKSVHRKDCLTIWRDLHCNTYAELLNTTSNLIAKITGKKCIANTYHIPIPIKKDMIEFIYMNYKDEIYTAFTNSKIRKGKNINTIAVAFTLEEIYKYCIYEEFNEIKIGVIHLSDSTTKEKIKSLIKNNNIICINDSEELIRNSDNVKQWIAEFFTSLDVSNEV